MKKIVILIAILAPLLSNAVTELVITNMAIPYVTLTDSQTTSGGAGDVVWVRSDDLSESLGVGVFDGVSTQALVLTPSVSPNTFVVNATTNTTENGDRLLATYTLAAAKYNALSATERADQPVTILLMNGSYDIGTNVLTVALPINIAALNPHNIDVGSFKTTTPSSTSGFPVEITGTSGSIALTSTGAFYSLRGIKIDVPFVINGTFSEINSCLFTESLQRTSAEGFNWPRFSNCMFYGAIQKAIVTETRLEFVSCYFSFAPALDDSFNQSGGYVTSTYYFYDCYIVDADGWFSGDAVFSGTSVTMSYCYIASASGVWYVNVPTATKDTSNFNHCQGLDNAVKTDSPYIVFCTDEGGVVIP